MSKIGEHFCPLHFRLWFHVFLVLMKCPVSVTCLCHWRVPDKPSASHPWRVPRRRGPSWKKRLFHLYNGLSIVLVNYHWCQGWFYSYFSPADALLAGLRQVGVCHLHFSEKNSCLHFLSLLSQKNQMIFVAWCTLYNRTYMLLTATWMSNWQPNIWF